LQVRIVIRLAGHQAERIHVIHARRTRRGLTLL
jgi:hypothetical protein